MSPLNDAALIRESWKIFQIMAEFVEGFERLAMISPSVSLFGSARTNPDHPNYRQAEKISEALSNAGFSIVSGGGPGIMEAINKGGHAGKSCRAARQMAQRGTPIDAFAVCAHRLSRS